MATPEVNELNANANGGTELTVRGLYAHLSPEELEGIQIIPSRVRTLDPDKIRIYHLHDLPNDPEAAHLSDPASRERFDRLVFVSNWQYQQYQTLLGVPYSSHSCVIENGVEPLKMGQKDDPRTNPIRIIYTPTPHRGLEILVPVFEQLAMEFDFIELDVFSSFSLYGWPERDVPYQPLFDRCEQHPRIRYHGTRSQDVVRAAYQKAHIFAYPSIWPETSCRCLIEAMMAGCMCIHPNYGALPDTSAGLTHMYDGASNLQEHQQIFTESLRSAILMLRSPWLWDSDGFHQMNETMSTYANHRFGWPIIAERWRYMLRDVRSWQER